MDDPLRRFRVDGRVALVTGGSRGLGAAIAEALAFAGADVAVAGTDAGRAGDTAAAIAQTTGRRAIGLGGDVASGEDVAAIVERTVEDLGRLDILVNSAGIVVRGAIGDVSGAEFDRSLAVNVTGTWLACRAAGAHMRAAGWGRVINLASTFGLVGAPNRTAYAASKGAVVNLTRALALEWAQHGVTVNALAPGPFLTDMNIADKDSEHAVRVINQEVAMRRWAEIHEIQGAALFLASEASSFVTGSVLVVDGGWTAH